MSQHKLTREQITCIGGGNFEAGLKALRSFAKTTRGVTLLEPTPGAVCSLATDRKMAPEPSAPHLQPARPDPRDPDHSRTGVFVYHNCWRCYDGQLPCVTPGGSAGCPNLHARND